MEDGLYRAVSLIQKVAPDRCWTGIVSEGCLKGRERMIFLSWITLCLRLLVAAVFVTYACGKLRHPSQFAAVIRSHRLIPDTMSNAVAWGLTLLELVLGGLFLFNVFPLIIGIAIGVLLILFSAILLRARLTPRLNVTSCGCAGASNRKTSLEQALFRNLLLLCAIGAIVVTMSIMHFPVVSLWLLLLIECILLVCIVFGAVGVQTRLFASLLRVCNIQLIRRQGGGTAVAIMQRERRSFIKWSVQLGVAALVGAVVLWNGTADVLAVSPTVAIAPCPNNESCDCGPGGSGPWSGDCEQSWNCTGHEGEFVPITWFCVVYCCGSGNSCKYYRYQQGTVYCAPPGGGC